MQSDVVFKFATDRSADALRHFGGRGCVRLSGEQNGLQTLERIRPGTSLDTRDVAAVDHLWDVAAQLHSSGLPEGPWPTIESWGGPLDRDYDAISPPLTRRAAMLYRDLAGSQEPRVLLHGDLRPGNVLLDEVRGWIAIDPKGVVGEPAYEFGAALRNLDSAFVIERWSRTIAERSRIDRSRILGWAFAQAVLAAMWSIEDGDSPDWALAAAARMAPLL